MRIASLAIGRILRRILGRILGPILALTFVCAGQAWADVDGQTPAQANPLARYAFNRVNDGFLRLDNVTGNVAYCAQTSAGWVCQPVPEDRAALEKEIARLQDEVASLKQEVAAFRDPAPPRPPAELSKPDSAPPSANNDKSAELRSDMKRAGAALKNAWDSLVDMISNFQKDMMRKG